MECGLLGRRLGHSYSPRIHRLLGDYSYSLFEKEPEELADFLEKGNFSGLNVTIPYKKAVIPYCAALSPEAARLGAVNTLVRRADGSLMGHNTDYFGFLSLVRHAGFSPAGKKALVLGSGGASATAQAVLRDLGGESVVISRRGENHYGNLERHRDARLVVNCTPVGMFPQVGESPLSLEGFPRLEGVLDMVYNPARTALLLDAERLGIPRENGLWMLVAQAVHSAGLFTGRPVSEAQIAPIYRSLRRREENLILIGMPGTGKTTVGRLLAERLGKEFADADELVQRLAGRSIPEIFAAEGEAGFRKWESLALAQLGKSSGLVIATGGGCVTQPGNYPLLHQNGRIFWLRRDIALLPTQGRPLSQAGSLSEMLSRREPMYRRFADYTVENMGPVSKAAEEIIRIWEEKL